MNIRFISAFLLLLFVGVFYGIHPTSTYQQQIGKQEPAPTSVPVVSPICVCQPTSSTEQNTAANQPESVWHQAFGPPLWSNLLLAAVGLAAVVAAFCTLGILKKQTTETTRAAKAAEESIKLQYVAMEQWIDTEDWEAGPTHIQPTATEAFLPISFAIVNTTRFKLFLERVDLWIDREAATTTYFRKQLLTPDGGRTSVEIQRRLVSVKLESYRKGILRFEIGGVVSYVDAFRKEQKQNFGFHCTCQISRTAVFEPIAFDPPDAREIEAQQRREARTKQTNPN